MKKLIIPVLTTAGVAVAFSASVGVACAAETPPMNTVKAPSTSKQGHQVTYHIFTQTISEHVKGKGKITVYRFHPGVYVVNEGDDVTFELKGVANGACPVVLEGYDMRGVIHRNQTIKWHFTAHKPGIFKLTCSKHANARHQGPMEGYLVVIPKKAY